MGITPNYDLDIDSTLGGDNASDYVIPSQKAIKSYVDNNTGSTVDQVYDPTSQAAQSGVAIAGANFLTSSDLADYVTTNTDQNITGVKTFVGQKMIAFKQASSSNKLGFTLYNNNNVEKGYLEFNPTNTIDGAPLMTLGNYASSAAAITHIGFRKYSSVSGASGAYNLLAPLISDARTPFNLTTTYTNFYLPLGFTNGTNTVLTAKTGVVDISSLLPSLADYVTNSSLATTLTDYVTNSALTTTLADYQPLLTSGTNIKTVNNTSLLGSGNIDVLQNTATDNTSISILGTASNYIGSINMGVSSVATNSYSVAIGYGTEAGEYATAVGEYARANGIIGVAIGNSSVASAQAATALGAYAGATALGAIQIGAGLNSTASTLSVGFSGGSNYQMLDGITGYIPNDRINPAINTLSSYVAKSGDTMTGGLLIQKDDSYFLRCQRTDAIKGTTPSSSKYWGLHFLDSEGGDAANRLGSVEARYTNTGTTRTDLVCDEPTNGSTTVERISIGCTADGDFYTYAPKPIASSDTTNMATTNWVHDNISYRANNTVTGEQNVSAFLTSSKTRVYFTIHLPKKLNKISTITVTKMLIHLRVPTGGYLVSDGWNALSNSTITVNDEGQSINVVLYSTSAFTSYTNNLPLCGMVEFGFKFT